MDLEDLLRYRAERDRFLAEHYASPLPDEHRAGFRGLDYFPPDPAWAVPGTWEEVDARKIPIPSTAGTHRDYTQVATIALTVGTTPYRLIVLDDGDGGRFIPFRDATCGTTTYRGGRYVGVTMASDGSAVVDFNRAANPWCVYDDEFTCPLPPPENLITEAIPAGERVWQSE